MHDVTLLYYEPRHRDCNKLIIANLNSIYSSLDVFGSVVIYIRSAKI